MSETVLLMTKLPGPGKVKSRLARMGGEEWALGLYRNFVLDILSTLEETPFNIVISFYPPDGEGEIASWLGKSHDYLPQVGKDLGERLKNSLISAFSNGARKAVALASDVPDLPPSFIRRAFESLDSHDAVIGPCPDGGYYLIGFRKDSFRPEAFDGIDWGMERVFGKTMELLNGRSVSVLPEWRDMDTMEDVLHLFLAYRGGASPCPRTMAYLEESFTHLPLPALRK